MRGIAALVFLWSAAVLCSAAFVSAVFPLVLLV
jgi:hypothetical protein